MNHRIVSRQVLKFDLAAVLALAGGSAWAQSRTFTLDADFDTGALDSVNHDVAHDQLQLNQSSQSDPFAYVAQPTEGTLLKIDTSTGRQVARYETVYRASCPTCPASNNTNANACGPWSGNWSPSRTAVDFDGNVWVANRAFGSCGYAAIANDGQGSITKIGNKTAGTCVDRNGNGAIDTSNDANGDGIVNKNDPAEFLGQDDECLIKSIAVGPRGAILRAITLDTDGTIWVGGFNTQRAYHIDPTTGAQIEDVYLGTTPYGFVVRGNYLYAAALGNRVVRMDKTTKALSYRNASGNYGITVDQNGVAWFGTSGVQKCDFTVGTSGSSCTGFGGYGHSGVTVDGDGQIWAAGSGYLQKYSAAGVLLGSVPVSGTPYGVAVASDGRIFSAGQYQAATVNAGAVGGAPGTVHQYMNITYPGITYSGFAYTYSDMTGFIARNVTLQTGKWTVQHDSGAADSLWTRASWNNEPQGFTSADATLRTEIRAANSIADLGGQAYTTVSSGADISALGIKGRYVEIRVTFQRTSQTAPSPVLSDLTIEWRPSNRPPVARCLDRDVCTSAGICTGTADINDGSFDPDGDPLTLNYTPAGPYSLGLTTVTLSVSDGTAGASCSAGVTVRDCENPVITCPATQVVECTSGTGCMQLTPVAATATDNCSIDAITQAPAACFAVGTTATHYSAVDGSGNTASCASAVTVQDTRPPVVSSTGAGALWPPNHKMVTIGLEQCGIVVSDACTGSLSPSQAGAAISYVTSDEVPNSTGDGNTEVDIVITDPTHVDLRQERKGNSDGRVYAIHFTVTDAEGNTSEGICKVTVPHSQSARGAAVDSGEKYRITR